MSTFASHFEYVSLIQKRILEINRGEGIPPAKIGEEEAAKIAKYEIDNRLLDYYLIKIRLVNGKPQEVKYHLKELRFTCI